MTKRKNKTANLNLALMQVAPADPRPKLAKELNACPPASWIVLCFILTTSFFVDTLTAQNNKTTEPNFETYKQINVGNQYYTNSNLTQQNQLTPTQNNSMGSTDNDVKEQVYINAEKMMGQYMDRPYRTKEENQEARMKFNTSSLQNTSNKSLQQEKEILNEMNETHIEQSNMRFDASYYKSPDFLKKSKSFADAFNTLNNMLTGKIPLSISKAYYTIESAYGNTYLTEKEFNDLINQSANFIKQWLIQNGYNPAKNEDLQYGLQKFMRDTLTISIKQPENKLPKKITHFPFSYDYVDFKAEKDYRNYFITKCLATGSGQCNSLPGVYLAIAERLKAITYLSIAPQHSFVKYTDSKGAILAYEPTSNWKISDKWYVDNMGIKNTAINSGIYLDVLNNKQVIANCMLDLAYGYMKVNGAADGKFVSECINTALQYYPQKNNITAYFVKSSLLARQLDNLLSPYGINDIKDVGKVQGATEIYNELRENEALIKKLGYQEMPEEIYLQLMQVSEFKGKKQQCQNTNTKQKRSLFKTIN